eukprot:15435094-Alexandrium_andersonii.AAC.1
MGWQPPTVTRGPRPPEAGEAPPRRKTWSRSTEGGRQHPLDPSRDRQRPLQLLGEGLRAMRAHGGRACPPSPLAARPPGTG